MTALSDNLFALEADLIDRLREATIGFRTIASPSIISGSSDVSPLLPAAFVQPGLGVMPTGEDAYSGTCFDQRWSVFVAVPHWQTDSPDYSATGRAGPLMSQVIAALDGWSPDQERREPVLRFLGHSEPNGQLGFVSFELSFQAGLLL